MPPPDVTECTHVRAPFTQEARAASGMSSIPLETSHPLRDRIGSWITTAQWVIDGCCDPVRTRPHGAVRGVVTPLVERSSAMTLPGSLILCSCAVGRAAWTERAARRHRPTSTRVRDCLAVSRRVRLWNTSDACDPLRGLEELDRFDHSFRVETEEWVGRRH